MPSKWPDSRSPEAQGYRKWYSTARWQRLAWSCYVRDNFTCQRTGIILAGKYPAPNSPVANHIKPHKGDPVLFWDPANIETIAKSVHDSPVQSEERVGFIKGNGQDGRPLDPQHPWARKA